MPTATVEWTWEEAFYKFGFGDGDGLNFTECVADCIRKMGYEVDTHTWGIHNYMIHEITDADGRNLFESQDVNVGYDDPREYLPKEIIEKLDEEFPE